MQNFDFKYKISDEANNEVLSSALMAVSFYAFEKFSKSTEKILPLMELVANVINPNRVDKATNAYNFFSQEIFRSANYEILRPTFSRFESLKDALKSKITPALSEGQKEDFSIVLSAILFGYSSFYSQSDEISSFFKVNQNRLYPNKLLIKETDLEVLFTNDYINIRSDLINLKNLPITERKIASVYSYLDTEHLFTGKPPIVNLMKDCEVQSYRISGQITPKYFSGSAADLLIFNPNLRECQQIVSGGETGFSFYPCAKESIRPRELIFNQLIFDGPYTSGGQETADLGIPILREIENETYTQDRKLQKIQHMGVSFPPKFYIPESYIASYSRTGWIFDEFTGYSGFLSFIGDVNTLSTVDILKKFPFSSGQSGAPTTGNFHFLGKRQFITGKNVIAKEAYHVGDVRSIGSGFSPIVFRLNKKENDEIYSGLEINLFDKVKNSGILMTYSLSPDVGILSSHRPGEVKFPSLNIENVRPSLPFMGISADFSSKNFNINPSVKFNFGTTTWQTLEGGDIEYGIEASDFSFTGFNFTGQIFSLSSGKTKYTAEISSTGIKPVSPAFTTLFDKNGNPIISDSKFLLQKALGFPLTGDCLSKANTGAFYEIDYSYYNKEREDVPYAVPFWVFPPLASPYRVVAYPPAIEVFAQQGIIGDPSILKYIGDHTKKISRKQVFGPLDEPSDSNLGVGFNQRMTSIENPADEDYKYVRNLNPARYYSRLFASNKKVFLYPAAENVYNSGSPFNTAKKSFPNKISVTYEVEEQYFKKVKNFGRFSQGGRPQSLNSLKDKIWVDQNFSYPNASPNAFQVWTYKPGNPGVNLNGIIYNGLDFPLDIEKGSIRNIRSELFFDLQRGQHDYVNHTITPLFNGNTPNVEKKVEYEITVDYTYTPPIKSLSDWQIYPIHAHRAFVSTGEDTLINVNLDPIHFPEFDGKWSEALNKKMNDYYGQDPLFLADIDAASTEEPKGDANKNVSTQNLSGDAWNGFYIKNGAVAFPIHGAPYRVTSEDSRLFLFHNNLKENRIFIRNADIFPAFIHSPLDSSFNGKNLANFCFFGEKFTRQRNNFVNTDNSCFEISGKSLFSGGLDKEISYKIQRSGKLYHVPLTQQQFDMGSWLPEITGEEYAKLVKSYGSDLDGYRFFSSMEDYARSVRGYYVNYEEGSAITIKQKSFQIHPAIFPEFYEIFEFENSGKLAFSGEFSYNSQEESCVITHGLQLNEKENKKDKFQDLGFLAKYASPILDERLNLNLNSSFPTRQIQRKNKIISEKNKFIKINQFSPAYHNHFHMNAVPEYVFYLNEPSLLISPVQDTKFFPLNDIKISSSYDYKEQYVDGTFYEVEKIDKAYETVKSIRFYDSLFCDSILIFNSGIGFVEKLPTGLILESNKKAKSFLSANSYTISEIELDKTHAKEFTEEPLDLSKVT